MTDLRAIKEADVVGLIEASLGAGCADSGVWMRVPPPVYPVPPSWPVACCSPTEPRVNVVPEAGRPPMNRELVTMESIGRVPIPGTTHTAALYAGRCRRCQAVRWVVC